MSSAGRNFITRTPAKIPIPLSKYTRKESLWYEDPNYVITKKNRLYPTIHKYLKVESKIPNATQPNPLNTPIKLIDTEAVQNIINSNYLSDNLSLSPKPYIYGFSCRIGLVGFKAGMMTYFDHITGKRHPVTVINFDKVQSLGATLVGARRDRGLLSVDVGAGSQKPGNMTAARRNYYSRFNVPSKRVHMCFSITKDALVPPGTH